MVMALKAWEVLRNFQNEGKKKNGRSRYQVCFRGTCKQGEKMRAGRRAGHFGSTASRLGQARAAYLGHTCDAVKHGLGAGGLQTEGQG